MSPNPSEQVYQSTGDPRVEVRPGSETVSGVAARSTGSGGSGNASTAARSPGVGPGQEHDAARPPGVPASSTVPRKVRLTVARVDPWSVLKLSFLLSVAMGIGMVSAAVILWEVVNAMGVLDQLNKMMQDIAGTEANFNLYAYVGLGRVVSLSTFVGVINIVIVMALCTLGAFLYNIAATLVGGIYVTLSDD